MPRRSRRALLPSLAALALTTALAERLGAQAAPDDVTSPSPVASRAVVPSAHFGEGVVRAARRYLGVRYVLGGDSPRAFDCSGFVRWVFAERGVAMPRTAREQAGVGDAPYPGDLQAGDLLFFWGGSGAQHVAIYAGGDSIIHASSRGRRVQVDRMRGQGMQRDWFGRRLIAVRRVVPAAPSATATAGAPAARATVFAGGAR